VQQPPKSQEEFGGCLCRILLWRLADDSLLSARAMKAIETSNPAAEIVSTPVPGGCREERRSKARVPRNQEWSRLMALVF
jgi:hypothetical protein